MNYETYSTDNIIIWESNIKLISMSNSGNSEFFVCTANKLVGMKVLY